MRIIPIALSVLLTDALTDFIGILSGHNIFAMAEAARAKNVKQFLPANSTLADCHYELIGNEIEKINCAADQCPQLAFKVTRAPHPTHRPTIEHTQDPKPKTEKPTADATPKPTPDPTPQAVTHRPSHKPTHPTPKPTHHIKDAPTMAPGCPPIKKPRARATFLRDAADNAAITAADLAKEADIAEAVVANLPSKAPAHVHRAAP